MSKVNNLNRAIEQLEDLKRAGVEKIVIYLYSKAMERGIILAPRGGNGFEIDSIRQLR